jgi:hypothetical protein
LPLNIRAGNGPVIAYEEGKAGLQQSSRLTNPAVTKAVPRWKKYGTKKASWDSSVYSRMAEVLPKKAQKVLDHAPIVHWQRFDNCPERLRFHLN